jgi:hypothetical protein
VTGGHKTRSGARRGELLLNGQVTANWVTPQARDGEQRGVQSMKERVAQGHSMSLPEQIVDTEPGSKAHTGTSLTDAAVHGHATGQRDPASHSTSGRSRELWTTPCADDTGARKSKYAQGRTALSTQVRARLNHRWVAQLMGFPSDWLDGIDEQP